jgi:hypothetical protein
MAIVMAPVLTSCVEGMSGHHSEIMFSRENVGKAGQWLVDEATRLFPTAFQ